MTTSTIVDNFWEEFSQIKPLRHGQKESVVLLCGAAFLHESFCRDDFDKDKKGETDQFKIQYIYNPLADNPEIHGERMPGSMYSPSSFVPILVRADNTVITFEATRAYLWENKESYTLK